MLKQVHDRNCGEKSMQEQVFLQELWPMKHLCWSSLVLKDCSPCRSPILELWKNVKRKAQQRWIVVDWSQLPISYSLCAPWVGVTGAGDEGVKFSLGKSMGESIVSFCLFRIIQFYFWQYIRLFFSKTSLFWLWQQLVSNLPAFLLTQEVFHLIFSPVLLRRGSERAAGWVSGSWPRSIHHNLLIAVLTKNNSWLQLGFSK